MVPVAYGPDLYRCCSAFLPSIPPLCLLTRTVNGALWLWLSHKTSLTKMYTGPSYLLPWLKSQPSSTGALEAKLSWSLSLVSTFLPPLIAYWPTPRCRSSSLHFIQGADCKNGQTECKTQSWNWVWYQWQWQLCYFAIRTTNTIHGLAPHPHTSEMAQTIQIAPRTSSSLSNAWFLSPVNVVANHHQQVVLKTRELGATGDD
jgi:hypothetical protein